MNVDMMIIIYSLVIVIAIIVCTFGIVISIPDLRSWYYHFTDEYSLHQILKSGYIKKSTDIVRDAAFGQGVYLTKLDPTKTSKETIAINNYTVELGNCKLKEGKLDTYIKLLLKDKDVQDVSVDGRNIYLYTGDLILSGIKRIAARTSSQQA